MSRMSDYLEVQLRNHIFRTNPFTKPTALHISLHVGDPTDTGTGGAEVTGGSYARVARAPLDANWTAASAVDGITTNAAVVNFITATANWGTVTHFGIWDAATAGNMLCSGPLGTPQTINTGGTPSFAAGAIVITFQ
jgi:hypothetical protein